MDSSQFDVNIHRNVQYEDRIYNTSGVTTEHIELFKTMQNASNEIEHINNFVQLGCPPLEDVQNFLSGFEIITVDPNCIYSSDNDVEDHNDDDSMKEIDNSIFSNEIFEHDIPEIGGRRQHQESAFDLSDINFNFMLNQHDNILFGNDDFDLTSYIVDENITSNLLLSPPPPTKIRQGCTSAFATSQLPRTLPFPAVVDNISTPANNLSQSPKAILPPTNAANAPCKDLKNSKFTSLPCTKDSKLVPATRRKRKNISKAFIDSSDEGESSDVHIDVEDMTDGVNGKLGKKAKMSDVDPTWGPDRKLSGIKTGNEKRKQNNAPNLEVNMPISLNEPATKDSKESNKLKTNNQQKNLRNIMKQHLMSNGKKSLTKTLANKLQSTGIRPNIQKTRPNITQPIKVLGVGRGKDINLTAKYYNSAQPSIPNGKKAIAITTYDQVDDISSTSDSSDEENERACTPIVESIKYSKVLPYETGALTVTKNEHIPTESNGTVASSKIAESTIRKSNPSNNAEKVPLKCNPVTHIKKTTHQSQIEKLDTDVSKSANNRSLTRSGDQRPSNEPKVYANSKSTVKCKTTKLMEFEEVIQTRVLPRGQPTCDKIVKHNNKVKIDQNELRKKIKPSRANGNMKTKLINAAQTTVHINENILKTTQETTSDYPKEKAVKTTNNEKTDASVNESKPIETAVPIQKKKLNIQEYMKRKLVSARNGANNQNSDYKINRNGLIDQDKAEKKSDGKTNDSDGQNGGAKEESLYEEIIIVSMGCNTDISIPVAFDAPDVVCGNNKELSVASKSTVLLSNIKETIQKAASSNVAKISSNSLLSSIQAVVMKRTTEEICSRSTKTENGKDKDAEEDISEHGENKIIMHLPKNRSRVESNTVGIQTDMYFQFPVLQKWTPSSRYSGKLSEHKSWDDMNGTNGASNKHNYSKRNYRRDKSNSPSCCDDEHRPTCIPLRSNSRQSQNHHNRNYRRSNSSRRSERESRYDRHFNRDRSTSRSMSEASTSDSSPSSSRSSSSASSHTAKSLNSYGGSSSKSYYDDSYDRRPHSRQSNKSSQLKKRPRRSASPEERRIVYVGRIESDITKDDLLRKFSIYGPIKNVSIHMKETKTRYGFVTFEHPSDAFKAIDFSAKNPNLNSYDISFGGRRAFCRQKYVDMDNTGDYYQSPANPVKPEENSFDALLREVKERLKG